MQTQSRIHHTIRNLVFSSLCLGLCLVLPFFTGQIPQIGSMLCPMHIPVLLSGFLCGPWWAMAVGLVAPSVRFALFSMPPLIPVGLAMTFELAVYGLTAGLLYRTLPQKPVCIYISLIGAMLTGRIVWGIACIFIYGTMGNPFTWSIFLAGAFLNAIPGIIVQIVIIPVIVLALKKSTLFTP